MPGSQALIGGQTAAGLDTERTAARDNKVIMPLILAVVLLVLVALLRALVVPRRPDRPPNRSVAGWSGCLIR